MHLTYTRGLIDSRFVPDFPDCALMSISCGKSKCSIYHNQIVVSPNINLQKHLQTLAFQLPVESLIKTNANKIAIPGRDNNKKG